jgi:Fic family protein
MAGALAAHTMTRYQELDSLKTELDALRPLGTDKVRAVQEKLHIEWTYNSNALEGNPLTLGETSFFLREGLTSKGRPLQAFLEARNHIASIAHLEALVRENAPLSEELIRGFHSILFDGGQKVYAGRRAEDRADTPAAITYKQENSNVVQLNGSIKWFTGAPEVPREMEGLIAWWTEADQHMHPVDLAAQLHHRFVSIHPFVDGNGRIARLLMNMVLAQAGYTPAIIPVEERQRYLGSLQAADRGDYGPLSAMIEELVAKTLRMTIDVVEGRDAFDFDDLSRMLQTIDREAASISSELGSAVVPLEARSVRTAQQILKRLQTELQQHSSKIQASAFSVSVQEVDAVPRQVFDNPRYAELQRKLERATTVQPTVALAIGGTARYVPGLAVYISVLAGRFGVTLVCATQMERFKHPHIQQEEQVPHFASLTGSIYYEDWNESEITSFVLDILKYAYQRFHTEMLRRRELIAQEERRAMEARPPKKDQVGL